MAVRAPPPFAMPAWPTYIRHKFKIESKTTIAGVARSDLDLDMPCSLICFRNNTISA